MCDFNTICDGLRQNGGRLPFLALVRVPIAPAPGGWTAKIDDMEKFKTDIAGTLEEGKIALVVPTRQVEEATREESKQLSTDGKVCNSKADNSLLFWTGNLTGLPCSIYPVPTVRISSQVWL